MIHLCNNASMVFLSMPIWSQITQNMNSSFLDVKYSKIYKISTNFGHEYTAPVDIQFCDTSNGMDSYTVLILVLILTNY